MRRQPDPDDVVDGCTALEGLDPARRVADGLETLELVFTASIVDRSDRAAIDARLAEYRALFGGD